MRASACLSIVMLGACGGAPPGKTYYQQNIEPILLQKCAGNTSGCHSTNTDDPYAFAAGNFDVTSFDNVQKRRDVLAPFGAYPYPLLLIKAGAPETQSPNDPNKLQLQYGKVCSNSATTLCEQDSDCGSGTCGDQFLPIDVLHAGGSIIQVGSPAFYTLQTWLANGATETGVKPPTPAQTGNGTCSTALPPGFTAMTAMTYQQNAGFSTFKTAVQPILQRHGCVSSNCHGAPQSDFYITCGADDTQLAFNFSQAWSFVNNPVDDSQILRVPLAVSAGGRGHTGGDQFSGTGDQDYMIIKAWAQSVGKLDFAKDPVTGMVDANKKFFQDHVQPILLQRGCSFQACHSPAATNDFKLRSGTQGFFSAVALQKNYELLKNDFMALEFPDARRGRAVAKGIIPGDDRVASVSGIKHRAGSILETPGVPSDPAACGTYNPATSTPFCTIQEWISRERMALGTAVTSMNNGDTVKIVYVDRPTGQKAGRLEFDTFQGGADLMAVTATFGAGFGQQLTVTGAPASLTGSCGFSGAMDIGQPDVKNDGDTVVFAARTATTGWNLYTVSITNGGCAPVPNLAAPDQNGLHVHNFDPAWSPDGTMIVFASTRGKAGVGPTVSRKRMLPQSDLWRVAPDGTGLEQMTFLSNSEIRPHFMREGRVTMTTEKVSQGFYQLSGRRLNWDLTDYHPLLAQRKTSLYADDTTNPMSTKPSIGYDSATDIKEGADGSFLLILSDLDPSGVPVVASGAGQLATFNRSIGPFEQDRSDPGYEKSLRTFGDPMATGRAGSTHGYRSPFYMPDGQIMASYTTNASSPTWKIVAVDPYTNAQTDLIAPSGRSAVDAVIAYKYPWYPGRTMYDNRRQLVFGGNSDSSDKAHAVIHMPDAPMVFTVLTGNLRRGRPVDAFRTAKKLAIYTEGMCPPNTCTANMNGIYESRTKLGTADLASDGSVIVQVPAQTGVVLELEDGNGNPVVTMGEEHQLGPGERISMGISEKLFNAVCGGCHGSVSGKETDISVSASSSPTVIGN